jgi:hypothetical protein
MEIQPHPYYEVINSAYGLINSFNQKVDSLLEYNASQERYYANKGIVRLTKYRLRALKMVHKSFKKFIVKSFEIKMTLELINSNIHSEEIIKLLKLYNGFSNKITFYNSERKIKKQEYQDILLDMQNKRYN